jgi:hypothetical protein
MGGGPDPRVRQDDDSVTGFAGSGPFSDLTHLTPLTQGVISGLATDQGVTLRAAQSVGLAVGGGFQVHWNSVEAQRSDLEVSCAPDLPSPPRDPGSGSTCWSRVTTAAQINGLQPPGDGVSGG